jgi:ATP-binding cassette subfamily B protein
LTIAQGLLPVGAAQVTATLLDRIVDHSGPIAASVAALAACGVLAAGLPFLASYATNRITRAGQLAAGDALFGAINRHPTLELFQHPAFHHRLHLAREAVDRAGGQLMSAVVQAAQALVTVGAFASSLMLIDWRIAVLALLGAVPNFLAEIRLGRQRSALAATITPIERRRIFYGSAQTDPSAAAEIRLFGLGDFLRGRMSTELRARNAEEDRYDRRELVVQTALGATSATVCVVAIALAAHAARQGNATIGSLSIVLAAVVALQASLALWAREIGRLQEADGLLAHLRWAIGLMPAATPPPEDPPALRVLELDDIWFRYGPGLPWVLQGVTLRIEAGQLTGLVGLNGAGKSTMVKLMCGLLVPERGTVRWDGCDLRTLAPGALTRRISAVCQDFMCWDLTAHENIAVGDLGQLRNRAAVRAAARTAQIDATIEGLPSGYDTPLTRMLFIGDDPADGPLRHGGMTLSGGQWQRVAFARSMFRADRDLLILDEPSAGLDPEAEEELHQRLRELPGRGAKVLISHRLGIVRDAACIYVLADGVVAERGTHDELMARDDRYARLFSLQASGYAPTT